MCIFSRPATPPPPPPLPPAPPPPPAPPAPLPTPEPLQTDVNPQIKRAKSKKTQSQYAQGTGQLKVPLAPKMNTGGTTGVNT